METEQELQAQLSIVQTALGQLMANQRPTRVDLGSGEFRRTYIMAEVTYENLVEERKRIESKLALLQETANVREYRDAAHYFTWSKQ
jgi:hypothetical protein